MIQQESTWKIGPGWMDISPVEVDVWRTNLDIIKVPPGSQNGWFDEQERTRANNFHFPKDRDRYIAAHLFLREVLSRYLHVNPGELRFEATEYGKPVIIGHSINFTLSHSREIALLAVALDRSVGVDVEFLRSELEFEVIAKRFFSPREVNDLLSLPEKVRCLAFFSGWTRKEAYVKALGRGLSIPLDDFDVSLLPNEPPALLDSRLGPAEKSHWSMVELAPAIGYAGALVVEGDGFKLNKWSYSPPFIKY